MFGIGFTELIFVIIIAILFLGPDKLPGAIVKATKIFKQVKNSLNEAKNSIEEEINLNEIKEDAKKYKQALKKATNDTRKKLTFEELEDLKKQATSVNDDIKKNIDEIKNLGDKNV